MIPLLTNKKLSIRTSINSTPLVLSMHIYKLFYPLRDTDISKFAKINKICMQTKDFIIGSSVNVNTIFFLYCCPGASLDKEPHLMVIQSVREACQSKLNPLAGRLAG